MSAVMTEARSHQRGASSSHETSQLLLIISDGRGLFLEGMEKVQLAVRQAREANIFTVFVIIDNPDNKVSNGRFCFNLCFFALIGCILLLLAAEVSHSDENQHYDM